MSRCIVSAARQIQTAVAGPSRLPWTATACPRPIAATRGFMSSGVEWSGHNKWSKIKHKKGAEDAKKSLTYSKVSNEIYIALKAPGASDDPALNSRLATALQKAKDMDLPKANIEAVFARAKRSSDASGQSVTYEAVGPSGREAFIIECMSENPNRTISRIKEILHKNNCRIAPVSYLFERKGVIVLNPIEGGPAGFDELFDVAVEHGAEDVQEGEDEDGAKVFEIYTPPNLLSSLTNLLTSPPHSDSYAVLSSELAYIPTDPLDSGEDVAKVMERLEEEEEVVKVWSNVE